MSTFMSLLGLGTSKLNFGIDLEDNILTLRNIFLSILEIKINCQNPSCLFQAGDVIQYQKSK